MAPIKNNLTKDPDTLVYTIEGAMVEGENDEDIITSRIEWHGTSEATAQEIVDYFPDKKTRAKRTGPGRPATIFEDCFQVMKQLTGSKDVLNAEEIRTIKVELISWGYSDQMMKRARNELGYKVLSDGVNVSWDRSTKIEVKEDLSEGNF